MMRRLSLALLLAATVHVTGVAAQPTRQAEAMIYYHGGARQFIDGDLATAGQTVDAGLAVAPDNPRLRALRELIRQQEQEESGGGEQPDEDGEQGPQEQNPDGNGQQQGDAPSDPPDSPPQPGQPPPPGDGSPNDPASNGGQGGASPNGPERPAGRLDRAQAGAILDAVGGDERLLLRALPRRPTPGRQPERDW